MLTKNSETPTTSAQIRKETMVGKHEIDGIRRDRRGQHADEMHGPDADRQESGSARQQQAAAAAGRAADARRKAEAGIAAQDRDHHRERDEIWIVPFEHPGTGTAIASLAGHLPDVEVYMCNGELDNVGGGTPRVGRQEPVNARAFERAYDRSARGFRDHSDCASMSQRLRPLQIVFDGSRRAL